ncbi:MAG: hypothetical protein PVJ57_05955 [Phycisphaerae bacterium]|jgi:hypothetical protein
MRRESSGAAVAAFLFVGTATVSLAQSIDFETVFDGVGTIERQPIFNQYEASHGVTFTMRDAATGDFVGYPLIAKRGEPQVGFTGCAGADMPLEGQGVGDSYLATSISGGGDPYDLLVEYSTPVSAASGVLIDLDYQSSWPDPHERWEIIAYDTSGSELACITMEAEEGPSNPDCGCVDCGPGDGRADPWEFNIPGGQIKSILFHRIGDPPTPVVFDNFSPATGFQCPEVSVHADPWSKLCCGDSTELIADLFGGRPPFTYQWQQEATPGVWTDLDTDPTQTVLPIETTSYRVVVTDSNECEVTSDPFELAVCGGSADMNCDGKVDMADFGQFQLQFTGP